MAPPKRSQDLADQIKRDIDAGVYSAGDRLPGDRELAEEGWTSTGTVRDAYRQLEAVGYVLVRHGSGRYVRDRSVVSIPLSRYAQAGADDLGPWETATKAQGLNGVMTLIAVATMEATVSVADKLALAEAPSFQVTRRTRHAVINESEVLQIQHAWYPAEVARRCGLDREGKIEGGTLPALASEFQLGLGTERIRFQRATEDEVNVLSVSPGGFVARVERLLIDERGMPLELLQIAADPERVDFVYDGLDFKRLA